MTAKIVFMGTAAFSVPALRMLAARTDATVSLVISQPSRAAGRGKQPTPPPVAAAALELGLRLEQPESLKSDEVHALLEAEHADLFVVAAYGQILRQRTLDLPRRGCVNIHGSLLPRWRGAAPISWSIAAGDATTGVAIMQMERGLDTGPVFAQRPLMIGDTETAGELHDRLALLGADLLADLLPAILAGSATAAPQPARGTTYARMLTRADRTIPFSQRAASVADWINGMTPWPGAAATVEGELVLLSRARPVEGSHALEPGQVVAADARNGLFLAAGEGTLLEVLELQRAGKRVMPTKVVLNGWCPATGTRFEPVA